jgi:hypothetical protein
LISLLLKIAIVLILVYIIYQDFKYLSVLWWFFPILIVLSFIDGYININRQLYLYYILANIAFVCFLCFSLTVYFSIKQKKIINILQNHIGIGDIFFFFFLAFSFEPSNFILFLSVSSFFSLVLFFVLKRTLNYKIRYLPLAGILSIFYIVLVVFNIISGYSSFSSFSIHILN